jgi:nucleoside-diphosphate-sugar epimerase
MIKTLQSCIGAHLVIGAGPLGRATAVALQRMGHSVILTNRSGRLEKAPQNISLMAADISSSSMQSQSFEGVAAIYFCAQPPYHRWQEEFSALQAAVIKLASDIGARLIVAENLYGYGPVKQIMTEDFPLKPTTRKGRIRATMHDSLMKAHSAGKVKVAVARGSDFFGPFVEGSAVGSRVFKAVIAGKQAEVYGDPDTLHHYTFVEDFGLAMAMLGNDPGALGEVWHVPNASAVSTHTFLELAFKLAGQNAKFKKLGVFQLGIAGLFIPAAREMIEMLYEFETPFVVDDQKFVSRFGNIATSLDLSLMKTIEWAREQKI